MTYESIDARTFRLTFEDGSTQVFQLRDQLSLWQIKHMGVLFEDFMTKNSKNGSILMSGILIAAQNSSEMDLSFFLDFLKSMTGEHIGDTAMAGIGEVVGFLLKEDRIETCAAILFLKPGEKKLTEAAFRERIELFRDELDPRFILQGVHHFFGPKLARWKNTLTLLRNSSIQQTSQASEKLNPVSASSIATSESTTDTSTPLPMDIPSESLTS